MKRHPTTGQGQLFYEFALDGVVLSDHHVRKIDAALEPSRIHAELAPFNVQTRRPSIDPEPMLRRLALPYAIAIRSERELCSEV